MSYIPVPTDLNKVESKVMLGLSKRKLICFAIAIPFGFGGYLLGNLILKELGMIFLFLLAMPWIMLAIYQHDGRYLEDILRDYLKLRKLKPAIRKYKDSNKNKNLNRVFYTETEKKMMKKRKVKGAKKNVTTVTNAKATV